MIVEYIDENTIKIMPHDKFKMYGRELKKI